MDLKSALKSQYKASLKMLRLAIKKCPEQLWLAGTHPRTTWRIAFHAVYYTHRYLAVTDDAFVPWEMNRKGCADLWGKPKLLAPYSIVAILDYLDMVDANVESWVDEIDLDAPECGFAYYKGMNKLEHQLVNLRHLQGHVGQLSELLMQQGIEIDWVSKG